MTDQNVLKPAEAVAVAEAEAKKVINRRKYRNDVWTDEQVEARKKELSVEALPEGYVSMAAMDKLCRTQGIPVSKLVRATGGDRGMNPALDATFQIVFFNGKRYMPGSAETKGLELLKDDNFAKSPRKPREPKPAKEKKVKAPAGDGETGPVKGAKTGKTVVSVRPAPMNMNASHPAPAPKPTP